MSIMLRFIGPAADYLASVEAHWTELGLGTPPLVAANLTASGSHKFAESRKEGQRVTLFELLTGAGEPIINVEIHGGDEKLTADRLSPPLASTETVAHQATRGVLTLPVKDGIAAVRPKTPSFTIGSAYDPLPAAEEPDAPVVAKWMQPQGAHHAYGVGAIVQHGEGRWVSLTPANVWEPGVSGWREVVEAGQIWEKTGSDAEATLPEPEAAGEAVKLGVQVQTAPEERLTLIDEASGAAARDDQNGRELHGELIAVLDRLIEDARRSNGAFEGECRHAAAEAKERLGAWPGEVRVSAILRIERLRSLREADERRRSEPDPLVEPAEAGVAAALRDAVAAANLYIETDPYLAEQQRRLADPGLDIAISTEEAEAAEAEMEELDIADPALLAELRLGRETAEAGGSAGGRALAWLAGSWRNVVREMLRQVLAWVREQTQAVRASVGEATTQAKIATAITIADGQAVLAAMGLRGRSAASTIGKTGAKGARLSGRAFAISLGTAAAPPFLYGSFAWLENQFAILPKLGFSPNFVVKMHELLFIAG